jgi:hypothetical protein
MLLFRITAGLLLGRWLWCAGLPFILHGVALPPTARDVRHFTPDHWFCCHKTEAVLPTGDVQRLLSGMRPCPPSHGGPGPFWDGEAVTYRFGAAYDWDDFLVTTRPAKPGLVQVTLHTIVD